MVGSRAIIEPIVGAGIALAVATARQAVQRGLLQGQRLLVQRIARRCR